MPLTPAQLTILKADMAADATLNALPHNSDGASAAVALYLALASPTFWVWRTALGEQDIYEATSADSTTWSWPAYIARSQPERDAWGRLFSNRGYGAPAINPSLAQTRTGIADIFSGAALAPAQRAHLLALGRRPATRIEKLLATGTGSTGSPAVMSFEGDLPYSDVIAAWLVGQ